MAEADDNHPPAGAAPPGDVVAALIAEGEHLPRGRAQRGTRRSAAGGPDSTTVCGGSPTRCRWRCALGDAPLAVRLALDAGDHRRAVELADAMPA